MTLLSSSHRSLIKVFSLSGTLRGMNKIECFFKCQRKNIFPSGYTHWCWKVFSNWIFKFPFLNSLIIWLYNGGKLLWLKYIYIYIWYIYIYISLSSFEKETVLLKNEWVQFSVLLSPATHQATPWSYHNQLCPLQFRINSLTKCSLHSLTSFSWGSSLLWQALTFPVYMAPRGSFCGRHDTLGLSYKKQ